MATTAPKAMTEPPTVEPVTSLTTYDSAAGRPPTASPPMAPIAASATAQYSSVTRPMQIRMAMGMLRRGFLASSPAVVIASNPMYEKNAAVVPAPMPPSPAGENGVRLPSLKALNPIAQNSTRIASFSTAMAAVAQALSRTPRMSRTEASAITMTAGTLTTPPSAGPEESAAGSCRPVRLLSSSFTYWLQPTTTADTETPYARSRHNRPGTPCSRRVRRRRRSTRIRRPGSRRPAPRTRTR